MWTWGAGCGRWWSESLELPISPGTVRGDVGVGSLPVETTLRALVCVGDIAWIIVHRGQGLAVCVTPPPVVCMVFTEQNRPRQGLHA